MASVLDQIIAHKKTEVANAKKAYPQKQLEQSPHFSRRPVSLRAQLAQPGASGIIAEFKRQSPSKGVLNALAPVGQTCAGYVQAGASALSVLTDAFFFGGSTSDLVTARERNTCPILRKDFMVDEYQVIEAKAMGADVILLIASALMPQHAAHLAAVAHKLEMEVLLEIHDEQEWHDFAQTGADLVGVNNRNLSSFQVSLDTSFRLASVLPASLTRISESGIDSVEAIRQLRKAGYQGFLMGEYFMKQPKPEQAAAAFINQLNQPSR